MQYLRGRKDAFHNRGSRRRAEPQRRAEAAEARRKALEEKAAAAAAVAELQWQLEVAELGAAYERQQLLRDQQEREAAAAEAAAADQPSQGAVAHCVLAAVPSAWRPLKPLPVFLCPAAL